ncbi:MAG: polysaccharide deacetylase family protein [Fibrobacteres bacterium]|nr:polysaccharide deacetylase family protein [Fibrobacterota bacterium]
MDMGNANAVEGAAKGAVLGAAGPGGYAAHLSPDRLAIYLLHGVVEGSSYRVRNYNRKHLEADYFRDFLKGLLAKGRPLSMDDAVRHHQEGRPYPPHSFAITFDDGFWNNLSVAAPILKDLGIPAMFYVTSGFVEDNAMSWIDRIEECIEAASPDAVKLPWRKEPDRLRNREEGILFLDEVRRKVKGDPAVDVDALIADIARQCGMPAPISSASPLDRKMTWPEVRELAGGDGFTVGGHSHRHGVLAFLGQEELEREIDTSLDLMREKAGLATRHYSYPEGLAHCFDERVIRALKERGIVCSPTAMPGTNAPEDDLFLLRRILVI